MTKEIIIFITAGNAKEAKKIKDILLTKRKAACVNIIPNINSYFLWKGKKEKAKEVMLVVKSSAVLLESIIKLVKEAHSYEVPEVIAVPIIGGNKDYLGWIRKTTIPRPAKAGHPFRKGE